MKILRIRETAAGYEIEAVRSNGRVTPLLKAHSEGEARGTVRLLSDSVDGFYFPRGSAIIALKLH